MIRHRPPALYRSAVLATLLLIPLVAACGGTETTVDTESTADFGACFDAFGSYVLASAVNGAGTTMLYLTASKPAFVSDDAWHSGDRALVMQDLKAARTRAIVLTWPPGDTSEIPVWATANPAAQSTARPVPLTEHMIALDYSATGERFLLGVRRQGVEGLIAKLYAGVVPAIDDTQILEPGHGLDLIPINDFEATEGIRSAALSPDGSKVAAVVGNQGEVRIYDIVNQELLVYSQGPEGGTVITHELPLRSSVSMDTDRQPAVASLGQMLVQWSPQGDRLAIATDPPGTSKTALAIMNPANGSLTTVRTFQDATVPQVAWSSDGQSLFVMTTELIAGSVFGNTAIRHIAAAEGGKDVNKGGQIVQPAGYNSEPANLVNFGDDQRFVFTWEGWLWRLKVQNGDLTQALAEKISPREATVPYLRPYVSLAEDLAVFSASTRGTNFNAVVRESASLNQCEAGQPGAVTPTPEAEGTPDQAGEPAAGDEGTAEPTVEAPAEATAEPTAAAPAEATAAATGEATAEPTSGG